MNPDIHKLLYPQRRDPNAPRPPKPKSRYAVKLSPTESRVLQSFVASGGDSNKRVAHAVGLAEATVKVHVAALMEKTGTQNRTQLALWAIKYGHAPMPEVGLPPGPGTAVA
jgi:DNA-binding NarL/FixJ family response regulator